MARYEHLPLYRSIYTFSKDLYRLREKLPKTLKHDLGVMVFQCALNSIKLVICANRQTRKELSLQKLSLEIEVCWTLLRLLCDLRGISPGEFKVLSLQLAEISRQAAAWLRWEQQNQKKLKTSSSADKLPSG